MTEFPNLINGQWTMGSASVPNINPSDTNDIVGHAARANADEMNAAVDAAYEAQKDWGKSTPQQRFDILDAAGTEILARKAELGDLLSREEGKTQAEGIGEAARAGQIFKFFAGETLRIQGERVDSVRPGIEVDMRREPVGVVGMITPWNFPIAIPAWKMAPALAFGNSVVLKAAESVPACAWALADILTRAGLPAGVLNLVNGRGSEIGPVLIDHPKVSAISFTGSVPTGKSVAENCAKNLKKVQLEMGGKNPMVVLDDADLDIAVSSCLNSAFFSTGQRCTASSRLIVTEGIHDKFVAALSAAVAALKVGDARDASTQIGPVIDERQLVKDLEYVDIGVKEGANLVCGGEKLPGNGHFMSPALFIDTNNDMRINQEEIFGPVATVIKVRDYDEALACANDTEFGLSAGICTTSLKYASDFKANSQAGMVMVNLPTAGVDYHVPFGGTKGSSYGSREQGRYAVEFYTTVKTSYTLP
jgi:alpha-ketoglutaric semialdehyde dehydrogenase